MNKKLDILSYAFAAIAGLCFASGMVVLSGGRGK